MYRPTYGKKTKKFLCPSLQRRLSREVEDVLPAWYRLRRHSAGGPNFPDIKQFTRPGRMTLKRNDSNTGNRTAVTNMIHVSGLVWYLALGRVWSCVENSSHGIWRRVGLVRTDVSEERVVSILWVERIHKLDDFQHSLYRKNLIS
jgi:hypothetical protein